MRNYNASLIGSHVVPEAHVIIQTNTHKLGRGELVDIEVDLIEVVKVKYLFFLFGLYAFVRQF